MQQRKEISEGLQNSMQGKMFLLMTVLIVCLLHINQAMADRERGCSGWIFALPVEVEDNNGNISFGRGAYSPTVDEVPFAYDGSSYRDNETVALIDGTGRCKVGQENKKCRKVAADAALKCARAIWDTRWERTLPGSVCGSGSNAKIISWAPGESQSVYSRLYGDIKNTIEYKACCRSAQGAKSVSVRVGFRSHSTHDGMAWTRGQERRNDRANKACSRLESFTGSYRVDCARLKAEGKLQCPIQISEASKVDKPKRTSPFQIKSAKVDFIKFPLPSEGKKCPRKVLIRSTFVTNKAGEVSFKLHRSQKPNKPLTLRAEAVKVAGKWQAVHERVITLNKSINRSYMVETTNPKTKVRASSWGKLVIRCDGGLSPSKDFKFGKDDDRIN